MIELQIHSYIKAIDNQNIDEIKNLKNKTIYKNIVSEIYNNGLLTSERLQFIIKNGYEYLKITSSLIKQLLEENEFELLDIIFNNIKLFDNEIIITLLNHRKNNTSLSKSELDQLLENYALSTKKDKEIWKDFYYSNYIYFINACSSGKLNLVKYLKNKFEIDINKANKNGETPLFYACKSGNEMLVKYLIEQGANIDIKKRGYVT